MMKSITLKDKLWGGMVGILIIIILIGQIRNPKIDTSKIENIQKAIDSKLDSINRKEYSVIIQKQNITSLEKSITAIQKEITSLNEKLKKDTASINTYSDSSIDKYLRARYHY